MLPNTKPNVLNELSNFIFTSKYAKYDEVNRRRETWEETVERVRDMHLKKLRGKLQEDDFKQIVDAFELVRRKLVLPSMRSMQFAGPAIMAKNERIFNCLGEETEFITKEGVKSFKDFSDGDETVVLSHTGKWRKAVVRCYGEDYLNKITISKGKHEIQTVYATKDHRWILRNGAETTDLVVGSSLYACPSVLSEFCYDDADPMERLYWCYGFVYGDGTVIGSERKYSMVRLCDRDNRLRYRFEEMGFDTSAPLSCNGDYIAYTGKYHKTTPDPKIDDPRLIRAFAKGYLDADGEKSSGVVLSDIDETSDKNIFSSIQSSDQDHIDFIRKCFPIAGIYTVSEKILTGSTNYGPRREGTTYFRICQTDICNSTYRVKSIEQNYKKAKVWCLEVEEDQSFVFPNGLVTGNCAVRHVDSIRSFAEIFFMLLCGNGVGIGLHKDFLGRLPDLVNEEDKTGSVLTYVVEDSIEGWADSVQVLLNCYFKNTGFSGRKIVFDYSKIRRRGTKLKTGGGKAPGYKGLKSALKKIKDLLDDAIETNKQIRLKSINAYDILMHCADAVLSGGIRRAATSVVFQKDDEDMLNAKIGNWHKENPQRGRSNNSILLLRKSCTLEEFVQVVNRTKEFGEPGFVFAEHEYTNYNPCFEIGFIPVTDDGICGAQFCNLTTMNGRLITDKESFKSAVWGATVIGTIQAAYTHFPYLGHTAEQLTENEALLGVSITGMMENPDVILNPELQEEMAEYSKEINKEWAKKLGINTAARITCIKPEGTSSLVLGTSSGIHPHHARKYIRRVQCNKIDPIYEHFHKFNTHATEESVWSAGKTDDVASFPLEISDTAIIKEDLDAIKHLEIIKKTQQHWVLPGTNARSKKLHHNVSCTVIVQNDEWDKVINYLFENREFFSAVSLLPASGDKDYKQAPMERISTEQDHIMYNNLVEKFVEVDYSTLVETEDHTNAKAEAACAGGACELTHL